MQRLLKEHKLILPYDTGINRLYSMVKKVYSKYPTSEERAKIKVPYKLGVWKDVAPEFGNKNNLKQVSNVSVEIVIDKTGILNAAAEHTPGLITIEPDIFASYTFEEIIDLLIHEITHELQPHKTTSAQYKRVVKLGWHYKTYFNERVEFEAYTSQMAHDIKRTFLTLSNMPLPLYGKWSARKIFLQDFKWFIKRDYHQFYPVSNYTNCLSFWRQDPKLWREFKIKMYQLLTVLESMFNAPRIRENRIYKINPGLMLLLRRESTITKPK